MRTLDAWIEAHLSDGRYVVFNLIELIGATTYRFTDAPMDVVWGGQTYTRIWFKAGDFVQDADGEVASTVQFEDASRTLRTIALAVDLNNYELKLSEVWCDATATVFGQDLRLHGKCDGVKCEGEDTQQPIATIAVRGLFADSASGIGPTQDYTKNCRYQQFKGHQCKYVGVAVFCDRLYTTCTTLGNTINFGGFRLALGDGERVQWGPGEGGYTQERPIAPFLPSPPPGGDSGVAWKPDATKWADWAASGPALSKGKK